MTSEYKLRGIHIPGAFPTVAELQHRFTEAGFMVSDALTLKEIRSSYIPENELHRCVSFLSSTFDCPMTRGRQNCHSRIFRRSGRAGAALSALHYQLGVQGARRHQRHTPKLEPDIKGRRLQHEGAMNFRLGHAVLFESSFIGVHP